MPSAIEMPEDRFAEIARRHGVRLLLLHGSHVSGHTHAHSDVDIAAWFERADVSFGVLTDLAADLQPLFPEHEVDVSVLNRADPLFLERVVEHARLLAGDPKALQRLRLYAFRRYQDHRRFLSTERRYVTAALDRLAG
jgi:predicted nucleotidyltransferase